MNKKRILVGIAAASSLAAAPLVSAAAAERASAPVDGANDLGGGGGALAFVAIGILAAFIAITVTNDDDEPVSA